MHFRASPLCHIHCIDGDSDRIVFFEGRKSMINALFRYVIFGIGKFGLHNYHIFIALAEILITTHFQLKMQIKYCYCYLIQYKFQEAFTLLLRPFVSNGSRSERFAVSPLVQRKGEDRFMILVGFSLQRKRNSCKSNRCYHVVKN